ncbi:MAG: cadherin repeat domain-containing protein [Magnetococcus sp. THC-1_WYH]
MTATLWDGRYITLSNSSIAENSAGASVGTLSATDSDSGDTATFSIVTDNSGIFEISDTTLKLKSGLSTNYEGISSYNVTLRVTDSAAASYDEVMTVTVTNVSEAATDMALSANSIAENSQGAMVGTLSSSGDPDSGDSASYSMVTDSSGLFEISGAVLKLKSASAADYEQAANLFASERFKRPV